MPLTGFEPAIPAMKRLLHQSLSLPGHRDRRFYAYLAFIFQSSLGPCKWVLYITILYEVLISPMRATFLSQPTIVGLITQVMLGEEYELQNSSLV